MSQSTEDNRPTQTTEPAVTVENGNGESTKQALAESTKITESSTSTTAWTQYLNSLNEKYQKKIQAAAQQSKYSLTIRNAQGQDETLTFTRMKLLQYMYDEIEDLRADANEATANNKAKESNKLTRQMYAKAATYILWNVREKRPMTDEEYKMSAFSEVRPALDASILLGLISDPN